MTTAQSVKVPPTVYISLPLRRDVQHRLERIMGRAHTRVKRAGQFRLGNDLILRQGRRVAVPMAIVAAHFEELVAGVKNRDLVIQHDADTFVDPDELKAMVEAFTGAPIPVQVHSDEGPFDLPDVEEPLPAEPEVELPPEPVVEPEPVVDLPPEPEVEVPKEVPVDVELNVLALPQDWKASTKRGLLELCTERGLDATEKMSNRSLVALLEDWELRNT